MNRMASALAAVHRLIQQHYRALGFCLIGIYLVVCWLTAQARSLWYDEVATMLMTHLPSLAEIAHALKIPTDSNPPLLFYATKASILLPGGEQAAARVPAILGFLCMSIVLFRIVRAHAGVVYGLCAAVLPALTGGLYYATEARPYGMLLGFTSIAILAWERTTDRAQRTRWLVTLALALAFAISTHYYSVLVFLAIGVGELTRTILRRKIDFASWAAIFIGILPLFAWLPLMSANKSVREGVFAPASWSRFLDISQTLFFVKGGVPLLVLLLAAAAAWFLTRGTEADRSEPVDPIGAPVWALWLMLLAAPFTAYLMGIAYTGILTVRYSLAGMMGFSILIPIVVSRLTRRSGAAAMAILAVALAVYLGRSVKDIRHPNPSRIEEPTLAAALALNRPVVIGDPLFYLPTAYYAPEARRQNLYYVVNLPKAMKYTQEMTAEMLLLNMRQIYPLHVMTDQEFFRQFQTFTLIWPGKGWLLPELPGYGAEAKRLPGPPGAELYEVKLSRTPIAENAGQ